jgi:hypothetical protein
MKLYLHRVSWRDSRTNREYSLTFTNKSTERTEDEDLNQRIEADNFDPVWAKDLLEEIEPTEGDTE